MRRILIVVDMQNDFVTGALGSEDAQKILPGVRAKIDAYHKEDAEVIFTRVPMEKIICRQMKESICRFRIVSRGQTDGRSAVH